MAGGHRGILSCAVCGWESNPRHLSGYTRCQRARPTTIRVHTCASRRRLEGRSTCVHVQSEITHDFAVLPTIAASFPTLWSARKCGREPRDVNREAVRDGPETQTPLTARPEGRSRSGLPWGALPLLRRPSDGLINAALHGQAGTLTASGCHDAPQSALGWVVDPGEHHGRHTPLALRAAPYRRSPFPVKQRSEIECIFPRPSVPSPRNGIATVVS